MENHLHLIAAAPELSCVMQSFKSYTAKRIIELLEHRSAKVLLRGLRALRLRHETEKSINC